MRPRSTSRVPGIAAEIVLTVDGEWRKTSQCSSFAGGDRTSLLLGLDLHPRPVLCCSFRFMMVPPGGILSRVEVVACGVIEFPDWPSFARLVYDAMPEALAPGLTIDSR